MKGPGYKTSLDVRRTWKCPACGSERKLFGDVTSMTCNCRERSGGGVFMTIVSEKIVAPRPFQPLNERDIRSSEFGIEEWPVLLPHPSSLPAPRANSRRSYIERQEADATTVPTDKFSTDIPSPTPPLESIAPQSTDAAEDDWGDGIL